MSFSVAGDVLAAAARFAASWASLLAWAAARIATAFATKAAIRCRSRIRRAVSKSIVGAGGNAISRFVGAAGGPIRISHGYGGTPGERCGERRRFEFGEEL